MDTVKTIPIDTALSLTTLDWPDIEFGLENELLSKGDVERFAAGLVATSGDPDSDLVELAGAGADDDVKTLVRRLARKVENSDTSTSVTDKWLYVVLAWLFDQRATFDEPLKELSGVYADFGYPSSIKHFVPYMPMVGENLGTREANEARLYERWLEFVERGRERFGPAMRREG